MHIEHIAMYVNDIEKTREFFIKYFGAVSNDGYHNVKTDFRSYFLSFDDGVFHPKSYNLLPFDGPSESITLDPQIALHLALVYYPLLVTIEKQNRY